MRILIGMVTTQNASTGEICVGVNRDKYMFGDIDNADYTYFDSKGMAVGVGEGRVVNDIQFVVGSGKVPASNAPNYETFTTNTKEYAFDVNEYIFLNSNEPAHGADFTSNATFHVHVTNKTANSSGSSQYVKIQLIVGYAAVGSVWAESTFTGEVEIPDGTAAMTHFLCALNSASFALSGVDLGGQINGQVKRIAATGGTEYADSAFFTQIGMHEYEDQGGSRTVSSKL